MSNWIESDDKKTCAYYKIIHRKLCLWGKQEFSRRKRYPKIEKPAWNIFHFIRSVNEMRKMQRTTGERYVPNSWQLNWHLRLVSEDLRRKATLPVADCIIALASCMRILSDHFQEATKHSVLVPFCGLLLSVSVCRLPRSATSQSMWVLSCTVKWPGLAHDSGRGCVK